MKEKSLHRLINGFVIISGIFLLSYTAFRSATLSFTHDESYTFIKYLNFSTWEIITYKISPVIANNHILNTLCMKWQSAVFGNSEFSLRLHSWISHVLYLIFSYLILKETKSKSVLVFGFILLNFNPYLLDFFSSARGYALSISLMLMSVFYFIKFYYTSLIKYTYISLLISILSVLANFVIISYSAALIVIFEFIILKNNKTIGAIFKKNTPIIITLIALFFIYFGPIKTLSDNNQLNFESDSSKGFDTVITSVICYLYSSSYYEYLLIFFQSLVLFTSVGFIIIFLLQFKYKTTNAFSYISIILLLILIFNSLQHHLLGGSYFRERFALFLVPLFFITFLSIILFLKSKHSFFNAFGSIALISAVIASIIIFSSSVNLTYNMTWRYDCDTKNMLNDLSLKKKSDSKIKLGITWLFEPTINFYRETTHLNWLEPVNRDGLTGDYDYFYVEANDLNSFDSSNKVIVKTYSNSGATLFKKIK